MLLFADPSTYHYLQNRAFYRSTYTWRLAGRNDRSSSLGAGTLSSSTRSASIHHSWCRTSTTTRAATLRPGTSTRAAPWWITSSRTRRSRRSRTAPTTRRESNFCRRVAEQKGHRRRPQGTVHLAVEAAQRMVKAQKLSGLSQPLHAISPQSLVWKRRL